MFEFAGTSHEHDVATRCDWQNKDAIKVRDVCTLSIEIQNVACLCKRLMPLHDHGQVRAGDQLQWSRAIRILNESLFLA